MHKLALANLFLGVGLYGALAAFPDGEIAPTTPKEESLPPGVIARFGPVRYPNYGRVLALAFAPDGRLAVGCWDGTVWLGDPVTRKTLRQWQAHDGMTRNLAFAPDGKVLASTNLKGDVRVWNVEDGRLLKTLLADGEQPFHIGFSPDGKYLAVDGQKRLRVWEWTSGALRYSLKDRSRRPGHVRHACAPAFSTDSKIFVCVINDDTLQTVDVATGRVTASLSLPDWWWQELSPSGNYLARFEIRRRREWTDSFEIWDVAAKRRRFRAPVHWYFERLAFARDERSLVHSDGTGRITVRELATGLVRNEFTSVDKGETCLACSPDGKILVTGSVDQSVLLWDLTGRMANGKWQGVHLTGQDLLGLWHDLAARAGRKPSEALWKLVVGANVSVTFLRKKLEAAPLDARRAEKLLGDLNAVSFEARERAFKELESLHGSAEPFLRKSLTENPSLELRCRLEALLGRIDSWWLRPGRALEVLERIGSASARQALEQLANGAPATRLRTDAQRSLGRLEQRRPGE